MQRAATPNQEQHNATAATIRAARRAYKAAKKASRSNSPRAAQFRQEATRDAHRQYHTLAASLPTLRA